MGGDITTLEKNKLELSKKTHVLIYSPQIVAIVTYLCCYLILKCIF